MENPFEIGRFYYSFDLATFDGVSCVVVGTWLYEGCHVVEEHSLEQCHAEVAHEFSLIEKTETGYELSPEKRLFASVKGASSVMTTWDDFFDHAKQMPYEPRDHFEATQAAGRSNNLSLDLVFGGLKAASKGKFNVNECYYSVGLGGIVLSDASRSCKDPCVTTWLFLGTSDQVCCSALVEKNEARCAFSSPMYRDGHWEERAPGTLQAACSYQYWLADVHLRTWQELLVGGPTIRREYREKRMRGPGREIESIGNADLLRRLHDGLDVTVSRKNAVRKFQLGAEQVADSLLKYLVEFPNLEELNLDWSDVSDSSLIELQHLHRLRRLALCNTAVTDLGLLYIQEIESLEHLQLNETDVTDEGMDSLAAMPSLCGVSLYETALTNAGFCRLLSLPKLKALSVGATGVDDEALASLRAVPNLENLVLTKTRVSDAGLRSVAQVATLRHLVLSGTAITDSGLSSIRPLEHLRLLNVSNCRIGDTGMEAIPYLRELEDLSLARCPITDEGMIHLAELRKLRCLYLTGTRITDRGLRCIHAIESLEAINVRGCNVTERAAHDLSSALPNCTVYQ